VARHVSGQGDHTPAVGHVCFISIEMFADRVFGGFGRATRTIGRELAQRGLRVTFVVPRRSSEYPDEYDVDGIAVRQFDPRRPWTAVSAFRRTDADVYHSQDTSLATRLAMLAWPRRKHVITFRDPMDRQDWDIETRYAGQPRLGWSLYRAFVDGPFMAGAVARADGLYCAAEFLRDKVARKYALRTPPGFLPTPVRVPPAVTKAARPTVCFVGRWEGRKRPEQFFELARDFPDVRFIGVGGAQDSDRDARLRRDYGRIPNLELTGFLDQFQSSRLFEVLSASWILVNTSAREGLPNTFLEACAHQCALLSYHDPDAFVSRFGRVAADRPGGLREGLEALLRDDSWRAQGASGRAFVEQVFGTERAVQAHLDAYGRL